MAFPEHIVVGDRVLATRFEPMGRSGRSASRRLVDYGVEFTDVLSEATSRALVGMSLDLYEDYAGMRIPVPAEWLLARFLAHHIAADTHEAISADDGSVLLTTTYESYLGDVLQPQIADQALARTLQAWIRGGVGVPLRVSELFASTNLTRETLLRSINAMVARGHLKLVGTYEGENAYTVAGSVLEEPSGVSGRGYDPSPVSNYYQEIEIVASAPFCFVIMPFREQEHPQRHYFEVIKPFLKERFGVTTYRVDEDALPDRIDNKIYTYMLQAEFIIAEITTGNPNVMYELGLAHAMNKRCILLTQQEPRSLPFDISRITVEPYSDDESLKGYLERVVADLMGLR